MTEKDISELLQTRRQALGLTLDDLAVKTGIPKPHLLALESQQFRLLPQERLSDFLERCAQALAMDELVYEPQLVRSSSRVAVKHQRESVKKRPRSYLPIAYLTFLAVSILSAVAYVVHQYGAKLEQERAKYAFRLATVASSSKPSQEAQPVPSSTLEVAKPTLTVTTMGEQVSALLSHPSSSVVLVATLDTTQTDRSWLGVTQSDLPPEGIALTAMYPQQTVTLLPDVTTATITFGVTKGMHLTIDGEVLELPLNISDGLTTITLTIQR